MTDKESTSPKVTIIVPAYNASKYLNDTIESVLAQSYTSWELILIDDSSTDNTVEIINKYINKDSRIQLIKRTTNAGGPAEPRNDGLRVARGEYIAFLDADDVWLPSKLQKQVDVMNASPNDIICAQYFTINEDGKRIGSTSSNKLYNLLSKFFKDRDIIIFINFININSSMFVRKKAILFRTEKHLHAIEDWLYWVDLLRSGSQVSIINEPLIEYRVHDSAISMRETDQSFRKALVGLAMLYSENKINLMLLFLAHIRIFGSIFLRRIKLI